MSSNAAVTTYATWNPSDKDVGVTLSNGNLTATNSTANKSVRATIGKSSGKWYWEVTNTASAENDIGIGNTAMLLSAYPGNDANGVCYDSLDGKVYKNNAPVSIGGQVYTASDIIGIALDVDAGTVKFYKNNALQYTYTYSIAGAIYPATGGFALGAACTANFGASAFTYTPPAGYNTGVYV